MGTQKSKNPAVQGVSVERFPRRGGFDQPHEKLADKRHFRQKKSGHKTTVSVLEEVWLVKTEMPRVEKTQEEKGKGKEEAFLVQAKCPVGSC